jgi:hypothetical protein
VIGPVAPVVPAFLVVAARIGAEKHATGLQGRVQLAQHPREFLAGHVEQDDVGEDAIETLCRQVECKQASMCRSSAAMFWLTS